MRRIFFIRNKTIKDQAGATPPVNAFVPAISGTPKVGLTVTANPGIWIGTPASYTYQWKRAGINIIGSTNANYNIVSNDANKQLSVEVTATNIAGVGIASSNSVLVQNAAVSNTIFDYILDFQLQ
jgi:hypothetical protein